MGEQPPMTKERVQTWKAIKKEVVAQKAKKKYCTKNQY